MREKVSQKKTNVNDHIMACFQEKKHKKQEKEKKCKIHLTPFFLRNILLMVCALCADCI